MKRQPIESDEFKSAGYDERSKMLELETQDGTTQRFENIDPDVYKRFIDSPEDGINEIRGMAQGGQQGGNKQQGRGGQQSGQQQGRNEGMQGQNRGDARSDNRDKGRGQA